MLTPLKSDYKITPVILAGGQGTRLQPLTSPQRPKPFLRILSRFSLFQETLLRASAFEAPVIVCAQEHADRVTAQAEALSIRADSIMLEPEARSTAAAIALAAFHLRGSGHLMLVLPSDHAVAKPGRLIDTIMSAAKFAENGFAVFGAKASAPSSRYGYVGPEGFVEKPDAATAKTLQEKGDYLWNTGIFLCAPEVFLAELQRQAPQIHDFCALSYRKARRRGRHLYPGRKAFLKLPSISVDYAVMEGCRKMSITEIDGSWSDVGCWPSLLRLVASRILSAGRRGKLHYDARYFTQSTKSDAAASVIRV